MLCFTTNKPEATMVCCVLLLLTAEKILTDNNQQSAPLAAYVQLTDTLIMRIPVSSSKSKIAGGCLGKTSSLWLNVRPDN